MAKKLFLKIDFLQLIKILKVKDIQTLPIKIRSLWKYQKVMILRHLKRQSLPHDQ